MKFTTSFDDGKLTLYLDGELDHHAAREAVEAINREIDLNMPRDCILDLDRLTFMDSSGIAVILGTYKRMNQIDGRCWVVNVQKQPMKVLNASGIYRMVEIHEAEKDL